MNQPMIYAPAPPVKDRASHGLHLFLTLLTGGLWGIVCVIVVVVNNNRYARAVERYQIAKAQYDQYMAQMSAQYQQHYQQLPPYATY